MIGSTSPDHSRQLQKSGLINMEWVVGFLGLLAGFAAGQLLLLRLLKDKSQHDLIYDRSLRLKYGLFNWLIAAGTCLCALALYRYYFPE
jgi:hypothetical protein